MGFLQGSAIPLRRCALKAGDLCPRRNLYVNVQSGTAHSSRKTEISQMPKR